jgi:hypothetical protein
MLWMPPLKPLASVQRHREQWICEANRAVCFNRASPCFGLHSSDLKQRLSSFLQMSLQFGFTLKASASSFPAYLSLVLPCPKDPTDIDMSSGLCSLLFTSMT